MKQTTAKTFVELNCKCPECEAYIDILDIGNTREYLGHDLRAENIELEIRCTECLKLFIITHINH
jgi:phage FluMu protein Com